MAYTPGFDYDIFISFSHQDNEPRPGQTTGWVERFVDYLKWWLSDRRGLTGLEVWWDKRRLTGVTELDSRIERDLGCTALLVVLHSENYRDSEYCEQELSWFVAAARSQPLGLVVDGERRIFNVLINKISHEEWTSSGHWTQPLAGTLGFEFHDAADDQDTFGDPIEDADPARYDAAMRPIVDAATRLLKAFPAPQDDPESQSTGRPPGDPRVQRDRIIVIDPYPADQHYGFELAAGLTRRAPTLNLEVTRDGAEPAERWTDFEQLVERARGLIVVSGNVDPQWVQKRIERAAKIAAAQLGGDMMLKTIWVARLQDGLSGGIPQPQLSLPPLIRVRILDDTDIGGILEAVVEHTARPRDEEERTERQSPISNPFVGLRPFGRADSRYYFGRDTQIQTLLASLHRNRFLAVVGSSGCGKSSLIRAGLIPALEASFLVQDRDRWRIATCKPGESPLGYLAAALLAAADRDQEPDAVTRLADRLLEEGAEAVVEILKAMPAGDHTNLLLVDQFEELFRFGQDSIRTQATEIQVATYRAQAEKFVELLLRLASRNRLPVYCVITMRSDFIGDCDGFTGLPEAINRGQFLVRT